jgi:hypothetical protein
MSEEMGSINKNTNLSSDEEEELSTDPQPSGDIITPVTEEGRTIEAAAATEEAMRGQSEPLETSTVEQPQLEQTRPNRPQKQP